MPLVLFNPYLAPYHVLPRWARLDLGAMVIKGYSAFPKAPASLEPHHQIVYCHIQDTRGGGSYPTAEKQVFNWDTAMSSNSNRAFTFIFGLIQSRKA